MWSSAEEMPSGYKHRDMLLSQMKLLLKRFNGPMEYLQSRYATQESKEQYAEELWRQFPPCEDNPPVLRGVVSANPTNKCAPVQVVHIATLSFDPKSSVIMPGLERTPMANCPTMGVG